MTIVVNLFGGPGTGKSTTAADLFAQLKFDDVNCEMALEYAKDKVWENSLEVLTNQIYMFGKQHQRIKRLIDKVDVVICDSPLMNCIIYDHTNSLELKMLILKEHISFNNVNVMLKRVKPYQEAGRLQNEVDAKLIDDSIAQMLDENQVSHYFIPADRDAASKIADKVKMMMETDEVS